MYQAVFKRVGVRLPFTSFERELLTEINTAPAQLHPNGWAFARAFQMLCGHWASHLQWTFFFISLK